MPFALLLIGILLFVSAYKNTLPQLSGLLKGDFSGNGNFLYWVVALLLVGGLGYFRQVKHTSRALMALILVVMILSDRGFFEQFTGALAAPPPPANPDAQGLGQPAGGGSGGGGGGLLGTIGSLVGTGEKVAGLAAMAGI